MINYVLGFLFDDQGGRVVLIEKLRPLWQAGKLNGVGGKYETSWDNDLKCAMVREFEEETGVLTTHSDWSDYCVMSGGDFSITVYRCFNTEYYEVAKTTEEEKVYKLPVESISLWSDRQCMVSNLPWLIALALDRNPGGGKFHTEVTYE
jgi:8-oxo-dGTP diphosphatase